MKKVEAYSKKLGLFTGFPINFYGGGEVTIINISKGFQSHGLDNIIYENESFEGPLRINDDFLFQKNISYQKIKFEPTNKLFNRLFQPIPPLETLNNHPINLIMIWRLPSLRQMKKLNKSNSKKIFLMHGIGLERIRLLHPLIIAYQIYMRIQLLLIKKSFLQGNNYFQVINTFQKEILLKFGFPQERIFLIKNGIDINDYYVGKNDTQFNVLFIGRLENIQKGISRLIKVAKYVKKIRPEINFIVAGSGEFSSKLKNFNFINYLGFITEEKKVHELANANLFLVTSNIEPFSLVTLEALFSGLPVISTPVTGPSEIIRSFNDFGKIAGFNSKVIGNIIIEYYNKWKSNTQEYYERKIARSIQAKRMFNANIMIENYVKMVFQVKQ
ncbi:MAG: glycosyltransferase family 4 protein [Thermoplasmata archaeon]